MESKNGKYFEMELEIRMEKLSQEWNYKQKQNASVAGNEGFPQTEFILCDAVQIRIS